MLTKGEILSIDFTGNTCTVRMPIFESTAGGDKAIAPAIFSNAPGIKDFYKVGDIVFIAFENGQIQNPVVIGKLFLGTNNEKKTESVIYGTDKIIPATTNKDIDINSVQDIIDNIKKLNIEKQELLSAGNNITITKIYADPETKTKYLRTEISACKDKIKIGNTELTEQQLIKLLELIENK